MPERGQTIGRIQAAKAVTIGLSLTYLIVAGLNSNFSWLGRLPSWWPNLLAVIVLIYLCI